MKPNVPQPPRSSYLFEAVSCPTPEKLQEVIDKNKDREGWYIRGLIPQAQGCILLMAVMNPKMFKQRQGTTVFKGRQLLTEKQAKELIGECAYLSRLGSKVNWNNREVETRVIENGGIDTFLTWLYERDYEICEKIDKKKEEST